MAGVDILASAFSGANAAFLGEQYARWATNPASVDPSFAELFGALNDEARAVLEDATGASWAPPRSPPPWPSRPPSAPHRPGRATIARTRHARRDHRLAARADADPLLPRARPSGGAARPARPAAAQAASRARPDAATASPTPTWTAPIFIDNVLGRESATLREIVTILRETYCGPIGVEFMHIQDPDQKSWIQRRVEGAPWRTAFDRTAKRNILQQLTEAEGFEAFCQKRYVTHQALRPGRRRGHHPGAARHHRDRRRAPACRRSPSACRIAAG